MIHVIATVTLKPGTREKFLTEFRTLLEPVRAEKGCIAYGPAVDAASDHPAQVKSGDDTVVVVEAWTDLAALKAHGSAPHMQAYRPRVKDWVVSTKLLILDPV
jgi:quinol monooxygenase YgiN